MSKVLTRLTTSYAISTPSKKLLIRSMLLLEKPLRKSVSVELLYSLLQPRTTQELLYFQILPTTPASLKNLAMARSLRAPGRVMKVFEHTADYDAAIFEFFKKKYADDGIQHLTRDMVLTLTRSQHKPSLGVFGYCLRSSPVHLGTLTFLMLLTPGL